MRAIVLIVSFAVAACAGNAATGGAPDAGCDPSCHWDCFGGSTCISGTAWIFGGGPRECCRYGDPWPDPGPACGASSYACASAACAAPDPRYQVCLDGLNRSVDCLGGGCEQLRLYCAVEGAAKIEGDACASDLDCRPAAEGVTRLRCDQQRCVLDARPAPPADYGAGCGLANDYDSAFVGEGAIETTAATCATCQIARAAAGGCLRQACTTRCTYDEDCPAGSICLCSAYDVGNYCAPATDRTTPDGRAAGLPACP